MGKFERSVFLVCFDHFELELERCWLALFLFLQIPSPLPRHPHREKGLLWACAFGGFSSPALGLLFWAGIVAGVCGGEQPCLGRQVKKRGPKEVGVPSDWRSGH